MEKTPEGQKPSYVRGGRLCACVKGSESETATAPCLRSCQFPSQPLLALPMWTTSWKESLALARDVLRLTQRCPNLKKILS